MLAGSSLAVPHDGDGEIESLRTLICAAVKFATHLRPDLDAIFSVWMCQRVRKAAGLEPIEVLFIPANTRGIEDGILAVDVGGGKGIQKFGDGFSIKASALGGSAAMAIFRVLPELERDVLRSLTSAVSYADEKGENVHSVMFKSFDGLINRCVTLADESSEGSADKEFYLEMADFLKSRGRRWSKADLKNQVLTSNIWAMHASLTQMLSDRKLLEWWTPIYDGMIEKEVKNKEGERAADKATYVLGRQLAILPFNAPPQASKAVFKRGAKVALFSSSLGGDRWTLGAVRQAEGSVDLTVLGDTLTANFPGIFINPLGTLVGWVSKSPLVCLKREFDIKRERMIEVVTEGLKRTLIHSTERPKTDAT